MAGPGGLLSRTVADRVLERLGGAATTGAGGGDFVVPGRVGAEVALPRSHLEEATRGELVKPHERVGSQ